MVLFNGVTEFVGMQQIKTCFSQYGGCLFIRQVRNVRNLGFFRTEGYYDDDLRLLRKLLALLMVLGDDVLRLLLIIICRIHPDVHKARILQGLFCRTLCVTDHIRHLADHFLFRGASLFRSYRGGSCGGGFGTASELEPAHHISDNHKDDHRDHHRCRDTADHYGLRKLRIHIIFVIIPASGSLIFIIIIVVIVRYLLDGLTSDGSRLLLLILIKIIVILCLVDQLVQTSSVRSHLRGSSVRHLLGTGLDLTQVLIRELLGRSGGRTGGSHDNIDIRIRLNTLQIRDQRRSGKISSLRLLLGRLQDDLLKAGVNVRIHLTRRDQLILDMHQGDRHICISFKRNAARHHLIHGDTQRIDVASLVAVTASGLLR